MHLRYAATDVAEDDDLDADALDAPLRRELDALYDEPGLDDRLREALDARYAVGLRPLP